MFALQNLEAHPNGAWENDIGRETVSVTNAKNQGSLWSANRKTTKTISQTVATPQAKDQQALQQSFEQSHPNNLRSRDSWLSEAIWFMSLVNLLWVTRGYERLGQDRPIRLHHRKNVGRADAEQ